MNKIILLIAVVLFTQYQHGYARKPEISTKYIPDYSHPYESSNSSGDNIDSLAICVLQGWMEYVRVIQSPQCLPRNEASEQELTSGNLNSNFFVPSQIAYSILSAILSYEAKKQYPALSKGYDKNELLNYLSCTLASLEDILDKYAFVDDTGVGHTGKKALYQVHLISGEAPRSTPFEQTVSMLDNLYLITALQVAANWTQDVDMNLSLRIQTALGEFDLNMWKKPETLPNPHWYIGSSAGPRSGNIVDRLVTEGRLIFPVALARGELDICNFVKGIEYVRSESSSYTSPQGIHVEHLPFFGRALEKWVPSVFLSMELDSKFGYNTLFPLINAQEEVKCALNLYSNEETPIADGFGNFLEFGIDPAESRSMHHNLPIILPPALMMQAGVMAKRHPLAACNFVNTMRILSDSNQLDMDWGPANYLDMGSGLVNRSNPVRSTLEIGQGAVALLNMLLGGEYLETLLRKDPSWHDAFDLYGAILNERLVIQEAETNVMGPGRSFSRGNACSDRTWGINVRDTVTYNIEVSNKDDYTLRLRYSNDDAASNQVLVLLDGQLQDTLQLDSTGTGGFGWNTFKLSNSIILTGLDKGNHTFSFVLDRVRFSGIELDAIIFQGSIQFEENYMSSINVCCPPVSIIKELPVFESRPQIIPNPIRGEARIFFSLQKPESVSIAVFGLAGNLVYVEAPVSFSAGDHDITWDSKTVSPGIYFFSVLIDGAHYSAPQKIVVVN